MSRTRKIGLFGGTFDPIHSGHVALARAALRRYRLDRIYFIPSGQPPHKPGRGLSPFLHRYSMVALACTGQEAFAPSLLEAGKDLSGRARHYTVDTVARVRRRLDRETQLYFLMGADQFLTLPTWKGYRRLLGLCEFIVATRPGFRLAEARAVLPSDVLVAGGRRHANEIKLRTGSVHLLRGLRADVSSSEIQRLVRSGNARWRKMVPPAVAAYMEGAGLYRHGDAGAARKIR